MRDILEEHVNNIFSFLILLPNFKHYTEVIVYLTPYIPVIRDVYIWGLGMLCVWALLNVMQKSVELKRYIGLFMQGKTIKKCSLLYNMHCIWTLNIKLVSGTSVNMKQIIKKGI